MVLVWHCLKMKGYDTEARTQWTNALRELRPQIDAIWLVTDSKFIKMGATVMGMVSSLEIHTVKSTTELESHLGSARSSTRIDHFYQKPEILDQA